MVENTAKLQEKIMALTNIDGSGGVDILTDSGDFKSTYQILLEISKVWEKIDDMDQAALLEVLAGKVRGSQVAAILQNGDVMEEAYESAINADGSAQEELSTYLDSIQGKMDQFSNKVQTLWMDIIDSGTIKGAIGLLTKLIGGIDSLINSIGLVPTALIAVSTAFMAIKKVNPVRLFRDISTSMHNTAYASSQIKAMQSLAPDGTDMGQFNANNINAYAAAVSNLSAKQQAATLASAGLNKAQIEQAMSINKLEPANIRQAISETSVATAKTATTTATVGETLAISAEGKAKLSDAAATWLVANSSKTLTFELVKEAVQHGVITAEVGAEIIAKHGLTAANVGAAASFKALWTSMKAALASNPVGMVLMLVSIVATALIPALNSAEDEMEEIAQKASELKSEFKSAMDTISDNVKTVKSLESEFEQLSACVGDSGENISLSTEDYERYLEIVNTLIDINPNLVKGYNEEGQAIIEKNEAIKNTIELLKEQQQLEAVKATSPQNLKTLAQGIEADIANAPSKEKTKRNFANRLSEIILDENWDWHNYIASDASHEGISGLMNFVEDAGFEWQPDNKAAGGAHRNEMSTIGQYIPILGPVTSTIVEQFGDSDLTNHIENNAEDIMEYMSENKDNLVGTYFENEDQYNELMAYLDEYNRGDSIESVIKAYQDEYTNTLYNAAMSTDSFKDLDEQQQKVLKSFIEAAFPVPEDGDISSQIFETTQKVKDMVDKIAENDDVKNAIAKAQNLSLGLDADGNVLNFDDYEEYSSKVKDEISKLDVDQEMKDAISSMMSSGSIDEAAAHVKNLLKTTEELEKAKQKMTTGDFLYIYYNISAEPNSMTFDELEDKMKEMRKEQGITITPIKTQSDLSEEIDKYREALEQTSEIVTDNIQVTQEYKDSLIELGVSEEELNECFYEAKPLVVKNSTALNNLLKNTKKNVAQNIKLSKSQARLEYYDLYKKIKLLTNGTKVTDSVTKDYIDSLYDQMGVLERTISKFSLLEAELLDTTNAYKELEDAQAADEAMDYGSKAEELVNVLAEAFNTAQLGTEAARVAFEGIIPDDVIDKTKTLDEQMQQAYEYFTNGPVSQLFTIEFDDDGVIESIDMTKENIQEFTESLIGTGEDSVFQGTWDEFTLNPAIENLDDFANAIGTTKEIAFAYLTELEKYDIGNILGNGDGSLLDQLMGDNLDYQLQKAIETAAEIEKRVANGEISVNSQEYQEAQDNLEGLEAEAVTNATSWFEKQELLEKAKQNLKDLEKQFEEAYATGQDTSQIESQIETVGEGIDILLGDLEELGEPTTFVLEVAMDETQEKITGLKEDIDELVKSGSVKGIIIESYIDDIDTAGLEGLEDLGFIKNPDGTWHAGATVKGWSTLDPESKQMVLDYINAIEDEHQLDILLGEDVPTVEETMQEIAGTIEKIYQLLQERLVINVETSEAQEKTSTFKELWDGITSKSVTLTQTVKTMYDKVFGSDSTAEGAHSVNGTAHVGGTAYAGGSWGTTKTETALVGELGPEIIVDPHSGRWHTVGDNGAEFTQVKRGSIIFNHKQTESLLKNGYVTGRGKAYASGTAYFPGIDTWDRAYQRVAIDFANVSAGINTYGDNNNNTGESGGSDSEDEFREVFDWIEVRLEELDEILGKLNAELENTVGHVAQNDKIDEIIAINKELRDNLLAGASEYYRYAETLLAKVPDEYRVAAQNGTIAIEEFVGEVDEETLNAIQEYRDWVQKGADATQQAEEVLTEISALAKQAFDNIVDDFENKLSFNDIKLDQYDAHNALLETDKGFESEEIYKKMQEENNAKLEILAQQRDAMQEELSKRVGAGEIKEESQDWYDAINAIAGVDTEIINLRTEVEDLQDSINELHWGKFDLLMTQFEAVSDEAGNLIDILSTKDAVDELGNWTDDGVTHLGLLAQQMEVAEMQAEKYKQEIEYLNNNWKALGYTQEEYINKLEELKSGQYDSIKAYHDTKDAIVDLNKERVDAIKDGIEKEIEAYKELIEKKKEELDAEKDLHDFQKSVMDQQKDIADIERKLAALSGDSSASARAQRAKLEAELAEAKAELEESYYDRSISNQQEALDKELDSFQEQKEEEIEGWEKYLESVELVVSDSLAMVQENTSTVLQTLKTMGEEFGLTITKALTDPWKFGETAIQEYGANLNISLAQLASMFGLTVDQFAERLGLTTEALVGGLNITVAQLATTLGLTNDEMAAKLGTTATNLSGMMDLTIQELAAKIGLTLPALAERLGTTTAGLAGNLEMTMSQFAGSVGLTVSELADKFGMTTTDLANKLGMTYQDLVNPFGLSMSATVDALKALELEYSNILASITGDSEIAIKEVNNAMQKYQEVKKPTTKPTDTNKPTQKEPEKTITVGGKINAGSARIYATSQGTGGGKQYFASDPIYTVLKEIGDYVLVRHHKLSSGYTGWFKKSDIKAYAKGTTGTKRDELAWIDEMGLEELVMHAGPNGKLQYLTKGTSVIPHDISENLVRLGQLDPSDVLRRNTPQISVSPSIINNTTEINMEIAEVVHIDRVDNETLPDLAKVVRKEMDSYMTKVNNAIRKKTR